MPPLANAVPHLHIRWDYDAAGLTPAQVREAMQQGEPRIEVNPGSRNNEALIVGVWMMEPGDDAVVAQRLREVLEPALA